jgi:hypothetical protein
MTRLVDLHRAVQTTLAGKRLGTPVFVRYLLFSPEKPNVVLPRLAQTAAVVQGWINQPVERIHATGIPKSGQTSVLLEFRGGATAIIAWANSVPRGDGVDLLVLGNHGAIYHDAGQADLWDDAAQTLPDAADERLREWIERAMKSGRPETAARGGKP